MVLVGMLLVVVQQFDDATGQRQRLFLAADRRKNTDLTLCGDDIGIEFVEAEWLQTADGGNHTVEFRQALLLLS